MPSVFAARQGRAYASAFEATQPYGTARLAGLKVLVRSVCVLAALIAVGLSVWASLPLLGDAVFIQMFDEPLRSWLRAIEGAVGALTGYEQLALAVVASIGVAVMVASLAALTALSARYPRRLNIAGSLLSCSMVSCSSCWRSDTAGTDWRSARRDPPGDVLGRRTSDCARDRLPLLAGVRGATADAASACGAVLVSAAFGAAWLTMLRAAGVSARRDARDGRRLDAVAGAAAADGQRPGALVAQPHSPYVREFSSSLRR